MCYSMDAYVFFDMLSEHLNAQVSQRHCVAGADPVFRSPAGVGRPSVKLELQFRSVYKELHADRETGC